jgi:Predicted nucleotide-binding protein containing TIR-like domain
VKPKLFIASSVEGLRFAYAVQENLEYDADCTVWSQGVFTPSAPPVDDLVAELNDTDFGVFVFSPDDVVKMRTDEMKAVRDNVIFELGLFVGRLGRQRNFIVRPTNAADMHIPTDLTGMSPLTFNPARQDDNIVAALGAPCNKIRSAMQKLGPITDTVETVIGELDEKCVQLMSVLGPLEYFAAPGGGTQYGSLTAQTFDQAVQRLRSLKVLRFDLSGDAKQYAYHWTGLGRLVLEKYGFHEGTAVEPAPTQQAVEPTDFGLSREAIDLLLEAVKDTNGTVISAGTMHGFDVETNGRNFTEGCDGRVEAIWRGAVEELFDASFLEDRGGKREVFQVTSKGYKAGETLKPKE